MPSPGDDALMSTTTPKSSDKKKKKKHKDKKSDRKKKRRRSDEGGGGGDAAADVEAAVEGRGNIDGRDGERGDDAAEKSKDLPEATTTEVNTTVASATTTSKKKRRSRSSSGDTTAKKNADTATVGTISVQPPSSLDPIVIAFPSGVPSSLLECESKKTAAGTANNEAETGNDNAGDNNDAGSGGAGAGVPTFTWHRPRPTAKRGAVLTGLDATCSYASSCSGRGHDGRLTKLLVGLYDKATGKLVLRQAAERGTVFALSQSVTSYEQSVGGGGAGSAALSNMSITDRRRVLFESFGSSKKQKVLKSQAANVVSVDSVVGGESGMMGGLARQGGTISASNRMMLAGEGEEGGDGGGGKMDAVAAAYAEARRNFLPPFDDTATDPHRVYDAAEMAGEDAWNQISRVVDAVLRKQESDEGVDWKEALTSKGHWPPSILSLLDGVRLDRKGAKHRIKVVLFLKHCVRFHSKCHKPFFSGTEDELTRYVGVPPAVAARLFDIFATPVTGGHGGGGSFGGGGKGGGDGYAINKQLKDKRLVHILLLYLIAHGREMKVGSINGLCKDLKLELNDAANLLREAGCVAKKSAATGMMSVSLSVPLTFPPPKRGRKTG